MEINIRSTPRRNTKNPNYYKVYIPSSEKNDTNGVSHNSIENKSNESSKNDLYTTKTNLYFGDSKSKLFIYLIKLVINIDLNPFETQIYMQDEQSNPKVIFLHFFHSS